MMLKESIKLIFAEDHELFREGIKLQLSKMPNINLAAIATNGDELIELCKKHIPDIVLTDIKMPVKNGLDAVKYLRTRYPHLGIIALSMFEDVSTLKQFLKNGGNGYLQKTSSKQEMYDAIITVFKKENFYCQSTLEVMKNNVDFFHSDNEESNPLFLFKEIELNIINLICKGLTSKEIADHVYLSPRTIEGYRKKIQLKMNVDSTAGIIKYAIENKLGS
jgi:DNA-binding NarL/FixJ family response regulator